MGFGNQKVLVGRVANYASRIVNLRYAIFYNQFIKGLGTELPDVLHHEGKDIPILRNKKNVYFLYGPGFYEYKYI